MHRETGKFDIYKIITIFEDTCSVTISHVYICVTQYIITSNQLIDIYIQSVRWRTDTHDIMQRNKILWVVLWSFTVFCPVLSAVLGIDYGQQFIKAMLVSPYAPLELVLTPEAKRKDLSGLAIKKLPSKDGTSKKVEDIERTYGNSIGSLETRFPHNIALNLKPLLGKTINNTEIIDNYILKHPGVNVTTTDRNSLAIAIDGVSYAIEELVAMNLQEITHRSNSLLKENDRTGKDYVDKFVMTVPDFFDQRQRMALIDASSFIDRAYGAYLVSDGLSVALNFAYKQQRNLEPGKDYNFMIYDIGSGSVKTTLIKLSNPSDYNDPITIETKGYGFSIIGGSDFTLLLSNMIKEKFLAKYNSSITADQLETNPKSLAKINQLAEKIKLVLSANTDASGTIESIIDDIDFNVEITREEFESNLQSFKKYLINPITDALESQVNNSTDLVTLSELNGIILAGGSTRLPFVQKCLNEMFDIDKILKNVNADESAVSGVSLRGVQLFQAFKTKPLNVIERSIYDYSVEFKNSTGKFDHILFPKGTIYPIEKSFVVTENGDVRRINITSKENGSTLSDISIDNDKMFDSKICPYGIEYNITFFLNEIRTLSVKNVRATCLKKDTERNPEKRSTSGGDESPITTASGIIKRKFKSPIDVTFEETGSIIEPFSYKDRIKHIKRIKAFDDKDKKRFQLQEARNTFESSLYEIRNFLTEDEVISNAPKDQLTELNNLVSEYLEWLEDDSDDATKTVINKKKKKVETLKKQIEKYLKALEEPLGRDQFERLLEISEDIFESFEVQKKISKEKFDLFIETISEKIPFNVTEEYSKIELPKHLMKSFTDFNETVITLNETQQIIQKLLSNKKVFDKLSLLELYDLKVDFDRLLTSAEKSNILISVDEYRLNKLKTLYHRQVRAYTRKLEKEKKKLEQENSLNINATIAQFQSSNISYSNVVSSEFSSRISFTIETPTSEDIIHDEL